MLIKEELSITFERLALFSERERSLFSFRYTIPGYVFILLIAVINFNSILKLFEGMGSSGSSSIFAAFLTFISLMSGSVLRFLLSQGWSVFFNCCCWYKQIVPTNSLHP